MQLVVVGRLVEVPSDVPEGCRAVRVEAPLPTLQLRRVWLFGIVDAVRQVHWPPALQHYQDAYDEDDQPAYDQATNYQGDPFAYESHQVSYQGHKVPNQGDAVTHHKSAYLPVLFVVVMGFVVELPWDVPASEQDVLPVPDPKVPLLEGLPWLVNPLREVHRPQAVPDQGTHDQETDRSHDQETHTEMCGVQGRRESPTFPVELPCYGYGEDCERWRRLVGRRQRQLGRWQWRRSLQQSCPRRHGVRLGAWMQEEY